MVLHFVYTVHEARTLTITDIKKLLSSNMSAETGKAVAVLSQCGDLCSKHAVPSAVALKALGFLQVNMIAVLLEKKKVMKFDTVEQAAEDCVNGILREAKLHFDNAFQQESTGSSSAKSPGKTAKDEQAMGPFAGRCSHPKIHTYKKYRKAHVVLNHGKATWTCTAGF